MKFLKSTILALMASLLVFSVAQMHAMPANNAPFKFTQPDGSQITLITYGDEYFGYTTTVDGYTVMQDSNGYVVYAVESAGKLAPSKMKVHDAAGRSNTERSFISGIRKGMIDHAAKNRADFTRMEANQLRSEKLAKTKERSLAGNRRLTEGEPEPQVTKAVVMMVNFTDSQFAAAHTRDAVSSLLNEKDYSTGGATGSAADYYRQNSNEAFLPQFDVYGPYDLPQNVAYYGARVGSSNDQNPGQMVVDAIDLAQTAGDIAWADYANDESEIENLIIIYAGKGEADGGGGNTIWPHEWQLRYAVGSPKVVDGVTINTYACSSELKGSGGLTGIGVICHEFGHVLGYPDFYDADYTDNGEAFGLDYFSLMAGGGYINNGMTPPALSVFEREMAGWTTITEITEPGEYILEPLYENSKGYKINTKNANEYFVFENRNGSLFKWDNVLTGAYGAYMRGTGSGMLVYHVDQSNNFVGGGMTAGNTWKSNRVNNYAAHECMRIIMAVKDTELSDNIAKVFFPYSDVTSYTSFSTSPTYPLKGWNTGDTGLEIAKIEKDGNNIKLTVVSASDTKLSDLEVEVGQYDVTVSWDVPVSAQWTVTVSPAATGGSSFTTGNNYYNVNGLKPGTEYTVTVTATTDASNTAQKSVTTKAVESGKFAAIDVKDTYDVGEYVTLRVKNVRDGIKSAYWEVNGSNAKDDRVRKLTAGSYKLEAVIENTDGGKEMLMRYITVK